MTRILIVEDEAFVAIDLQELLKRLGYTVTGIFARGEDALSNLAGDLPDLILVDVSLAGSMSGVEMVKTLRQNHDMPIIYITAFSDEATISAMKETEPFEYILKPFNEQILRVTIEFALHKAQARTEQIANQRLLETTLKSIGDAVITTDDHGTVRFLNPIAERLTGWSRQDAIGRPLGEVFPIINEQTRQPAFDPVKAVLDTGLNSNLANNTLLLSKDGTEYPIEDSAAPIRDANDIIYGVVLVFRNVTERKQSELWLRRAQKLDSLGLLASGIAHDFNNILGTITVNASILQQREMSSPQNQSLIDRILRATQQAAELTNQLVTYAGGHPLNIEIVDLNEIIDSTLDLAKPRQPDGIAIHKHLHNSPVTILAERSQMQQVILNLLLNSFDAIGEQNERTELSIQSRRSEMTEIDLKHYFSKMPLPRREYVMLIIEDTGHGIQPDVLDKIFDPFFTTKPTGSGLGLAATLGIIYQCDGGINVQSQIGVGTKFTVILPFQTSMERIGHRNPHDSQQDISTSSGVQTVTENNNLLDNSKLVLIGDDQPDLREAMGEIITSVGYQTLLATDGKNALELYYQHAEKISMVILDVRMPNLNGIDALIAMRQHNPRLRAVLITGHADAALLDAYQEQLTDIPLVQKPFSYEQLVEQVESVFAREEGQ